MISEEDTDKYLAEVLEILKERFEGGDKSALLYAIYHCLLLKRPIPEWLRLEFLHAYEAHARFEIRLWDEVFGPPVPKGTHLKTEKRNAELRPLIIERVEAREAGTPIDKALFEKIGRELKPRLSGTAVADLYYDERSRELREMIHSLERISDNS
jgi:hypothetical protein